MLLPLTPLLMWLKVLLPVPKTGFLSSSFQYPLEVQGQRETVGSRWAGNPRLWASRAGNPRPGNPRAWRQVWRTYKQIQEQKGFTSHFTMSLSSHLLGFVNIFLKDVLKARPALPPHFCLWHQTDTVQPQYCTLQQCLFRNAYLASLGLREYLILISI